MASLQLASDTRWRPERGYEVAYSAQRGEAEASPGSLVWLSYSASDDGEPAGADYYNIAPISERLEQLGFDARRRRGRTVLRRELTGLIAPKLGHQESGAVTLFGLASADEPGAFCSLRSVRLTLVAFPGCMITVRHRPSLWAGRIGTAPPEGGAHDQPIDGEPFASHRTLHKLVEERWLARAEGHSVADLCLLVMRVVSATLQPAIRRVAGKLEEAEQVYFSVLDADDDRLDDSALRTAQRNLFELAGVLTSMGRELTTLTENLTDDAGWIIDDADPAEARAVVRDYRDGLTAVRSLRQDLRTSVDMTASTLASRQLVIAHRQEERARAQLQLAEEQRDRNDRFMRDATIIASLVLLPTLVATVYGANVGLPLKNRATGTIVMLVVMLVAAFAAWQALRLRYPKR